MATIYRTYWARQRLTERIAQAVLPPGATPTLDPVAGPGGEIYRYTLESDSKNLQELSEIQRWVVIPALKSVPGVVDDTNFGGFTTEYQLNLDPKQLQHFMRLGISNVHQMPSTTMATPMPAAWARRLAEIKATSSAAWA